jgi:SAM-dependent methyltransferase
VGSSPDPACHPIYAIEKLYQILYNLYIYLHCPTGVEFMRPLTDWDQAYRSGEYRKHWGIPYPSQELVGIAATIPSPETKIAIDIGCGAGQETVFLAQLGFTTYGFDQSEEALKIATARAADAGVTVNFQLANILQLPLADQSVDFINDRGCLHVIGNEQRATYAKEMARILKPGGKLFIRGCRLEQELPFTPINQTIIDTYFSSAFAASSVLPIELIKGDREELPCHLVLLTRN